MLDSLSSLLSFCCLPLCVHCYMFVCCCKIAWGCCCCCCWGGYCGSCGVVCPMLVLFVALSMGEGGGGDVVVLVDMLSFHYGNCYIFEVNEAV